MTNNSEVSLLSTFRIFGGKTLAGEIAVCGSKNAALPALAASLLFHKPVTYLHMPEIEDVYRMRELIDVAERIGKIDEDIAKRFRASILVVGPLLSRFGNVTFPHPGGCLIGARPIDMFLDFWRAIGARVVENDSFSMSTLSGLKGCRYKFRVRSVTGTEAAIMTAVLAEGDTVLENAALEPEVVSLAHFLVSNGAEIEGAGTSTIKIRGENSKLLDPKVEFSSPPDRIETGSFVILGALLGDDLLIKNCVPQHISSLLELLERAGVSMTIGDDWIRVKKTVTPRALSFETKEYPGFATDLQAPLVVFATQAEGKSDVYENIFEGRLSYVQDLNRMGARITLLDAHHARVEGPTQLHGASLQSPDLRAGLAFVIAALTADGKSRIGNVYQIDRGYEKIDLRLKALGAHIERV